MVSTTLRHLFTTGWSLRRAFDAATLQAIEQAITDTERAHGGEIRFAIDASRSAMDVLRGVTPRQHALNTFAHLGIWDTEANNGVLIYVSWADRDVEIVADRGFNGRVTEQEWAQVCRHMEQAFARGAAREAAVEGIQKVRDGTKVRPTASKAPAPDSTAGA